MERAELEKIAELAARFIQAEIADDPSAALLGSALYPLTQALQTAGYLQDISARQPQSKTPTTAEVLAWAVDMFGPVATNREERAARLLEEALEVAQCEGLDIITAGKIAGRVYARPRGELTQEIGGVSLTLAALAENAGRDLTTCVEREWTRVKSKPREWWTAKHAEKVKDGTANIPPAPESLITGTPRDPYDIFERNPDGSLKVVDARRVVVVDPHECIYETPIAEVRAWALQLKRGVETAAEAQASLADAGPIWKDGEEATATLTIIDNGAPGETVINTTWTDALNHQHWGLGPVASEPLTMIDNGAPGKIRVGITWKRCDHGVPSYSVCPKCTHASR